MRRCPLSFLLGAAVVLALGLALSAQQQPTFRTAIKTVPVYVTVTDAGGRLVTDLGRDDFEILDNGKPQQITVFANEIQPITLVLLLDRSGSMQANFDLERDAAEHFVTQLMPADKAKIGSFSWRVQVDPDDFTSDHGTLQQILRTELQREAGPTPLWNAVAAGMNALWDQQGRRVVLVFTDGADEPVSVRATNSSLKDVMQRAREEDVMVYAVGLTGRRPPTRAGGMGSRGGWGLPTGGGEYKPDKGLAKIAAESGGGYFELQSADDLASTFARVAEELHRQYALGFVPATLDGKTHKLDVRVKRAGMIPRARKSYVAASETGQ
jgi:Ca-activated chloride channel family protein